MPTRGQAEAPWSEQVRAACAALRAGAGYEVRTEERSGSFGDALAEFVGSQLRWRITRDRGHVFADVAPADGPRAGEYVQFLNVLHAIGDAEAVQALFDVEQRRLKVLGHLITSRHGAVEATLTLDARDQTYRRAAAAQEEYLRRTFG